MNKKSYICKMKNNADLKPLLIDLEADNTATGGKQVDNSTGQSERLSGEDNVFYDVYWIHLPEHTNAHKEGYVGITINFKERLKAHKKSKKINHFKNAVKKYGWDNLVKEILHYNLTLEAALYFEEKYRPEQNIGWNSQKGGVLGVEKEWYNIPENKLKHKINTSVATRKGISLKDTPSKRSLRAKENWEVNYKSYQNAFKGSRNSRAILNEEQVKCIKCELLNKGLKDLEIAKLYNVRKHVITWIRKGKNWKHVVCDSPDHK
jgi:hypothetical protein